MTPWKSQRRNRLQQGDCRARMPERCPVGCRVKVVAVDGSGTGTSWTTPQRRNRQLSAPKPPGSSVSRDPESRKDPDDHSAASRPALRSRRRCVALTGATDCRASGCLGPVTPFGRTGDDFLFLAQPRTGGLAGSQLGSQLARASAHLGEPGREALRLLASSETHWRPPADAVWPPRDQEVSAEMAGMRCHPSWRVVPPLADLNAA